MERFGSGKKLSAVFLKHVTSEMMITAVVCSFQSSQCFTLLTPEEDFNQNVLRHIELHKHENTSLGSEDVVNSTIVCVQILNETHSLKICHLVDVSVISLFACT